MSSETEMELEREDQPSGEQFFYKPDLKHWILFPLGMGINGYPR